MPNGKLAIAVDNLIKLYNPNSQEFEKAFPGH